MAQDLAQLFADSLKSRGKQPATIESYKRDAANFLEYLNKSPMPLDSLEPDHLFFYQEHLRENLKESPNSIRRAVIGVRQFFRFLTESKHLSSTPFDMVPIPPREETFAPVLEEDEIDALMDLALQSSFPLKGTRDAAIIALLAFEGVKASELIALRWSDFLQDKSGLSSLRVTGLRARVISLTQESTYKLSLYLKEFKQFSHPAVANHTTRKMFLAFKGRDSLTPSPQITRHGLKFMLYELGAKVDHPHLNTETLRHFATQYHLNIGRSPEEIMQHFGLKRVGNIAKHLVLQPTRNRPVLGKIGKRPRGRR